MNTRRFKEAFFNRIEGFRPFQQLLDLLPDVSFFVKDRRGRFVMHNLRGVESCGVGHEDQTIGKRDHDFFPKEFAALYIQQDRQVMETGVPITNSVCPSPEKGSDAMIIFSKVPLRDRSGRVIGLAGMWREVKGLPQPRPRIRQFSRALDMIHDRFAEALTVDELARAGGLSKSQFTRQFQRLFGAAPHQDPSRVRVNASCRLLSETELKTTDIALQTGFFDHSHFSRTFRRFMGVSPNVYRRRHQ